MNKKPLTYISLFSSAGVGCYGFKTELFKCIATVEILEKRLNIQKINKKCDFESAYISDDITSDICKNKIRNELKRWKLNKENSLDVLIATPPCQGMSVANHKKGDEIHRNSLVKESVLITMEFLPKFFIFENVRAFLNTQCTDIDGFDKKIKDVIELNLAGSYHINYEILNFKDYGNLSSRTRTLVIGTRKDLKEINPLALFPDLSVEKSLKESIGNLSSLNEMGEISDKDIYHNFRKYNPEMRKWISDIKEGQSAFENKEPHKIPHKIVDGRIVFNVNKNGDKYKRQVWNKVAPCIHTRNDILSSQNTIHPSDDRVFSIRELMILMSIPDTFKWIDKDLDELNNLSFEEKRKILSKEEMNIRSCIGEAVPTTIFNQIARKIKNYLLNDKYNDQVIKKIIEENNLVEFKNLINYLKNNNQPYSILSKIAELSNSIRVENSAYYTRQDICFSVIKDLPSAKDFDTIRILEPSIGVGNFLPLLIEKYKSVRKVYIDVIDIDINSLTILKQLLKKIQIPSNIKINFINSDFLKYDFSNKKYDIVVGNPPFKKITNDKDLLLTYKKEVFNNDTNNIFSFFIEKCLKISSVVGLIVPKSLISAPEFNKTREILEKNNIKKITDYGENAFKGVKIETISFLTSNNKNNFIEIESYITNKIQFQKQSYIFDKKFPYWLIYRNDFFDEVSEKMTLNVFKAYRDRQITKSITQSSGKYRVLKSRNIGSNEIVDLEGYDCYIDDVENLDVKRILSNQNSVLVPNLTYNPRACFLPKNTIVDGSVAVLSLKENFKISKNHLKYYSTEEFSKFYAIARNYGTRSLNIDNNSVFFFGLIKTK